MKKYIYLILVTFLSISVILMSGYAIKNDAAEVETFALFPKSVNNTVTVSGKLQHSAKQSVKVNNIGVIKEIKVSSKDKVKKGDLLFSYYKLNKNAEETISQYYDLESAISLLKDSTIKNQVLKEIKNNSEIEEVYSDYDGVIEDIAYSKDDIIDKSSEIMKITDESDLEIPVNINETYINKIEKNQKTDIVFTALPNETFKGTVEKIADEATQTSGLTGKETTVKVIIKVNDDIKNKVRIGYSADCSIITSTDHNILVVPYEYIRSDDQGDYVLIVKKNYAKRVYIKTGKEYKEGTEITSGLSKNDMIIKNCDDIDNGQKIKINGAWDND